MDAWPGMVLRAACLCRERHWVDPACSHLRLLWASAVLPSPACRFEARCGPDGTVFLASAPAACRQGLPASDASRSIHVPPQSDHATCADPQVWGQRRTDVCQSAKPRSCVAVFDALLRDNAKVPTSANTKSDSSCLGKVCRRHELLVANFHSACCFQVAAPGPEAMSILSGPLLEDADIEDGQGVYDCHTILNDLLKKYPRFKGALPPEAKLWTEYELETYLASNGQRKPSDLAKDGKDSGRGPVNCELLTKSRLKLAKLKVEQATAEKLVHRLLPPQAAALELLQPAVHRIVQSGTASARGSHAAGGARDIGVDAAKITRVAGREDTPVAVTLPLKRAVKFAGLQAAFLVFSLMLAILLPPAAAWVSIADTEDVAPTWVAVVIQAMHYLGNAATVLFLISAPATRTAQSPGWKAKVEELSRRGMTLRSLLRFYQEDIRCNLDWCYAPIHHKTKDVVRRVIIPVTSAEECSYAVSCMNRDGAQRAQIMVTHNWGNCFKDLLAAVISDALNECSFKLIANLLEEDCEILFDMLNQSRRLDDVYWICAFAVNQHLTICHNNPYDRDPVAQELHPVCSCSSVNISDPDGTSTVSEVNKFDDMMHHLASTGVCRQVIAVDQSLDLFMRAWCVAEIAEARRLQMNQALKLASKATIMQRARTLENVDVENMQASSEADKELILHKIRDSTGIGKFNQDLQTLIFDPNSGLLASWSAMDSYQQIGEVGRLIRWGLADAGTGKVSVNMHGIGRFRGASEMRQSLRGEDGTRTFGGTLGSARAA
eukprot:s1234_g1.t1